MRETEEWAVKEGLKPYRARQIRHWLLAKLVESAQEMTNIPKEMRDFAENALLLNPLEDGQDGAV